MNIYDIAKATGVSTATVSRVINGNGRVSQKTKERVLNYIEQNGYMPNAIARHLSNGISKTIAVIVPDIENPFFATLLLSMTKTAESHGYNICLFATDENPKSEFRYLNVIMEQRVTGLVIVPVSQNSVENRLKLEEVRNRGIPVVLVDRDVDDAGFDKVFSDDKKGAYEIVTRLIKEGHTRIGIVIGPLTSRPGRQRLEGYRKALEDHNVPIVKEYIQNGDFKEQKAYESMKKLINLPKPPTAVFSCNNLTTLGCIRCLYEEKKEIGRDISLVAFDDIEVLQYTNLQITVVDRPVGKMGSAAIELLNRKIEDMGQEKSISEMQSTLMFQCRIVGRGSEELQAQDVKHEKGGDKWEKGL